MTDNSYNNWDIKSDKAIIEDIGKFIQSHRLNQNKSQEFIASEAGISRSTLSLMERGEKVRIDSLIQVLRVLDLLYVFNSFNNKKDISPLEYAKLKKKEKKRASAKNTKSANQENLGW